MSISDASVSCSPQPRPGDTQPLFCPLDGRANEFAHPMPHTLDAFPAALEAISEMIGQWAVEVRCVDDPDDVTVIGPFSNELDAVGAGATLRHQYRTEALYRNRAWTISVRLLFLPPTSEMLGGRCGCCTATDCASPARARPATTRTATAPF
jgi:hypothetical protein